MASVEMDFDPLALGPFADEVPSRDGGSTERSANQNSVGSGNGAAPVDNRDGNGVAEQGADAQNQKSDSDTDVEVPEGKPNPYLCYFSGKVADYRRFRTKYRIPEGVQVSLVHQNNIFFAPEHIAVSLMAITEEGSDSPSTN